MSDIGQQAFSALGGTYSLEARLQNIRAKLSNVNSAVRNLESNMIFLLVNPELIYSTSSDSKSEQSISMWSSEGDNSTVVSSIRTDYGQEGFITNSIELSGQYAENMSARHDLMICQSEILSAIDEQKKKSHYANSKSIPNDNDNLH